MRCKTCEYSLWNLAARQCPECGSPFKPSDFEFLKGRVRFCCPHCDQPYFGTDAQGHLVPRDFTCVSCSNPVAMDDMLLRPAEGITDEATSRPPVPWLNRKKLGFFRAWLATIWMAMIRPRDLIRALPEQAQSARALWFAVVSNFFFYALGLGAFGLVMLIIALTSGRQATGMLSISLFTMGLFTCTPLLGFAIWIGLWALITHALLRITGPTRLGIARTFQALCYASGANVLNAIPCIGFYAQAIAWIWSGVSATLMLAETHKINPWRSALAVFLPPLAAIAAAITLFVAVALPLFAQGFQQVGTQTRTGVATDIAADILDWASNHSGQPPRHAVELLEQGRLSVLFFSTPIPRGNALDTTIAGVDVTQLLTLNPPDRRAAVERVLNALPPEIVAHRVGDIVFTHHGITLPPVATPDPALWLALYFVPRNRGVQIALADGSAERIALQNLPARLNDQNTLRAASNLPPLPDPTSITCNAPATAPTPQEPLTE